MKIQNLRLSCRPTMLVVPPEIGPENSCCILTGSLGDCGLKIENYILDICFNQWSRKLCGDSSTEMGP